VFGRARFLLEKVGPELRQYWFLHDKEERPFNRTQRNWVYQTAKGVQNTFGFGTEIEPDTSQNYLIVKHAPFPYPPPSKGQVTGAPDFHLPSAKVLGGHRGRRHAFRPDSAVNVSAMSFGSLSGPAVESINRGVARAGALQNTGEGGLSPHHKHGGDLVFQIGTGYFGCRDRNGRFSLAELRGRLEEAPIRALEIKLSQGAKPGLGGLLPASKVTEEIANVREVSANEDCVSPSRHSAFGDVDEMLDFVEMLAEETGLPVGIKSAIGESGFWDELARRMASEDRAVDFITVDGGEGGTGAAPLVFTDHVALPFKMGIARVYSAFAREGIADRVTFIGSGKLGFPEAALFAFALGCDMVNVGREAMLAIGCVQAQICHTGECPVGVATQSRWLTRALVPAEKSERLANYVTSLRGEILSLSRACGVPHPALVGPDHLEVIDAHFNGTGVRELFAYDDDWGTQPLGELEGMLSEIDEDAAHERREAAKAHGVTPFPEA
jgi:hypothetical protein